MRQARMLAIAALFASAAAICAADTYTVTSNADSGPGTLRQAIMDALRGNQDVRFQVHHLKVHNGWCWVDTTPLDKNGHATAEGDFADDIRVWSDKKIADGGKCWGDTVESQNRHGEYRQSFRSSARMAIWN